MVSDARGPVHPVLCTLESAARDVEMRLLVEG